MKLQVCWQQMGCLQLAMSGKEQRFIYLLSYIFDEFDLDLALQFFTLPFFLPAPKLVVRLNTDSCPPRVTFR